MLLAAPVAVLAGGASPAQAAACDLYAAPGGSDSALGAAGAPLRTAQKLVDSLEPGQTGCLAAAATFEEDLRVERSGLAGAPIRLTGDAGPRPTLRGRMLVLGDRVELSGLVLDGRNRTGLPSPTVHGDDVVFKDNDVTNLHTAICFAIGSDTSDPPSYGLAHRTLLDGNRIHNCGRLPATNMDHGIYVAGGRDVVITNNLIYDNADRGVQLFPDAQRTLVANNVIDGNGVNVNIGGWNGLSSSRNTIRDNVISNSRFRANVESWWGNGSSPGVGNVVERNCMWNGANGDFTGDGYARIGNYTGDPGFANAGAKDFTVDPSGPCGADGRWPTSAPRPDGVVASSDGSFGDDAPADAGADDARTVVTSSISSGETLSGRVRWSAEVTGPKPSAVEFLVGGKLMWTDWFAPYVFNGDAGTWDTSTLRDGRHRLTIRARSGKGVVARTRTSVQIRNADK